VATSTVASRARVVRALCLAAGLLLLGVALLYGPSVLAGLRQASLTPLELEKVGRTRLCFAVAGSLLVAASLALARVRGLRELAARRAVAPLLLALLGTLVPLSILEFGARPFATAKTSIFEPDPELGWRLAPNARGEWGGVRVAINGHGQRGPEVPYARSPGTLRILFLGDSVTFGYGVEPPEATFPYLTARELARHGPPVEVVNTGVGGYSPWQELLVLRREGPRYAPDLVVVGFVWNDITEKLALIRYGGANRGWQLDRSSASALERWLSGSGLAALLRAAVARVRFGRDVSSGAARVEAASVARLAADPEDPDLRRGWVTAFESLARIADEGAGSGARVVLVVFPYAFQLESPLATAGPQRKLLAWARARGLPSLDLLPVLLARARAERRPAADYFSDASHLSAEGHRVVSAGLAVFLTERALLAPGRP
jgi:lysophospholipase L1-like esterase